MLERYYLTAKGKTLLEAKLALKPEVLELLQSLESRTECEIRVSTEVLDGLLKYGHIGKMEEF